MNRNEKEYQYCRIWDDDTSNEGLEADYSFNSVWDADELEYLAEAAAGDYHSNHDGWEADWPLRFAIFKDDILLGKCEVYLEFSPSFSAGEI